MNDTIISGAFIKTVALIVVGASVVNVILAVAGKILSSPPDTFGPYMYSSVIGLTVGGVVAAAAVYAAMRYFYTDAAKADRHFIILSVVVLIASFYPDIVMPWSSDPDQVGWTYGIIVNLMLMHVVAAWPVIRYFPKTHA